MYNHLLLLGLIALGVDIILAYRWHRGAKLLSLGTYERQCHAIVSAAAAAASNLPPSTADDVQMFLSAASNCNRGQSSNTDSIEAMSILSRLEDAYSDVSGTCTPSQLSGSWELCFATDDITRSSPFFWAFRKALAGRTDSSIVKQLSGSDGDLAESIFFITDSVPAPLKTIGSAIQEISFEANNSDEDTDPVDYIDITPVDTTIIEESKEGEGSLVSKVEVTALMSTSTMTTTSTITPASTDRYNDRNTFDVTIATTEAVTEDNPAVGFVKQSIAPALIDLGLDQVAQALVRFPSGTALEQVASGSSTVQMRVTYIDETLRIVRPCNALPIEESLVFVYKRI